MALSLVTAPATEPITLSEAKLHLRIEDAVTDEDNLINALISSAREQVEVIQRRQLITATWKLSLDEFPSSGEFSFPIPPLVSVSSVKYFDTSAVEQTFASSNYEVDTFSEPGRLRLADGKSWPSTNTQLHAVNVEFVAGYGVASDVPEKTKQAILLYVGHLYENREATSSGSLSVVPMAVDALLDSGRWGFYI